MNSKRILFLLLLTSIKEIKSNILKNNSLTNFNNQRENDINIFIVTHKDFKNYRYNPAYKIIAMDHSKLHNKYNLEVIYCDKDNKLKDMDLAYGEMSKLYYIYNLYKTGKMSSKYIGLNHYRRYFSFLDDIPDMDNIFKEYDLITADLHYFGGGFDLRRNFCYYHLCWAIDEIIEVIKDIKPDYYKDAIEVLNSKFLYIANLFIMKKEDFLNYCEFMFDVLSEFDRRHNFHNDGDVLNYTKKYFSGNAIYHHGRIQGYLSERISTIFYHKYFNFSKIKHFPIVTGIVNLTNYNLSKEETKEIKKEKKEKESYERKKSYKIKQVKKEKKEKKVIKEINIIKIMKIVLIIIIITIILFMIIKLFCYEIRKRKEISKFKNKDVSVKRHVIRILDQKPQYIYLS